MQQNIATFKIKQNDTLPALKIKLSSRGCLGEKLSFDLTAVTACTFSMADDCGNLKVSSMPAQITCTSGGTLQYNWIEGDTDTSGTFVSEFELYFSDGKKITVPTLGPLQVNIIKDINGL